MSHRIKSLDTLRALAIIFVFIAHTIKSYGLNNWATHLQFGGIGVDLFFVLSGWLLGNQLFRDANKGVINVKSFWIKRWIRTVPVYYAVLTATILQQILTGNPELAKIDYYVFIQNYSTNLEILYISWSLAVEEQFYLFIAPFVLLLYKVPSKYRLSALFLLLALPSIFRILGWYSSDIETHVRVDGCIVGVIAAFIKNNHKKLHDRISEKSKYLFTISILFFSSIIIYRSITDNTIYISPLLISIGFFFWVYFSISNKTVMNYFYFKGAYYIATRSYCIYLLHPESYAIARRLGIEQYDFYIFFVFTVIVTIILSEILHRIVEVPSLKIKESIGSKTNA